jgi:hypothetical protein
VLHGVKARTLGEHPASEDSLDLSRQLHLVNLDEGGCVWRLGRRRRIAHSRRHLQRAELNRLVDRNLEMGNAPRNLVEGGEHGDRVLDRLGQSEARRSAGDRQANRKEHNCRGAWSGNLFNSSHHSAHLVNGQFSFRSGALLAWSLIGVRNPLALRIMP